jgi:hypothetical protein
MIAVGARIARILPLQYEKRPEGLSREKNMLWTIAFLAASALAEPPVVEELEERVTGAVFLEAAGPGVFGSLNGQVLFPTSFGGVGLRVGGFVMPVSLWGWRPVTIPAALTIRAGHRPWAFEGGLAVTTAWWFFGDDPPAIMFAPMLGVDHRAPSGLHFGVQAQVNWTPTDPKWASQPMGVGGPLPYGGIRIGSWFPRRD